MWYISVDKKIFVIIIKLIGKLSAKQTDEILGKKDSKVLSDWYYENRILGE